MTTTQAQRIVSHLEWALQAWESSNRDFCSEFCGKCDFNTGDGCFVQNIIAPFLGKYGKIKKHVIPNKKIRR